MFDSQEDFERWAGDKGLRDHVDKLEQRTKEAKKERDQDEAKVKERHTKKVERVKKEVDELADSMGVDLSKASADDWDRVLRAATIDRADQPIFDPVVLFEHINLSGAWLPVPGAFPDLRWFGWNDRMSSWWIAGGGIFFEHIWFGGARYYTFGFPAASFPWIGPDWNDRVSSVLT